MKSIRGWFPKEPKISKNSQIISNLTNDSNKKYSRNQLLRIIIITWILSFVTTLVVVNFVPAILEKSWHRLEFYQGTFYGSAELPDFFYFEPKINSDIWRIKWDVRHDQTIPPDDVLFYFAITNESPTSYPRNFVTKEDFRSDRGGEYKRYDDGMEYFVGSGEKYLMIQGIKLEWTVVIEEYY